MFTQYLADHAGLTHHQVDHAIRQVEFIHHAEKGDHGQRCLAGRLDDRGTTRRQGRRQLLGDHANGKVPGHNQPGYAHRPIVNRPGAVLGLFRNRVGIKSADVLGTVIEETGGVIHLALGFFPGLAMLHTQDAANLFAVFFQAVTNILQPLAAGFNRPGIGEPER